MADDSNVGPTIQYADVGINLTDPVFCGTYHGKQAHPDDLEGVINRAVTAGCKKLMITGSDVEESERAIEIAKTWRGICYSTVGIHPCAVQSKSMAQYTPESATNKLQELILRPPTSEKEGGNGNSPVAAIGEIGLDYDRLFLSDKPSQLKWFEHQLDFAASLQSQTSLPLFLHSRAAHEDFTRLLKPRLPSFSRRGLVHSFTGTMEEMRELVELGLDIGVNGCSLKTQENLDVVKEIPLHRLQLETDGPWCEIRPSHASYRYLEEAAAATADLSKASQDENNNSGGGKKVGKKGAAPNKNEDLMARLGVPAKKSVKKEKWEEGCMVKGRNESCTIGLVARVVAGAKGMGVEEVAGAAWRNSVAMFGLR